MGNQENKGLVRLINAWRYSMAGFRAAWVHEEAFRQEVCLAIFLIPAAFWIGDTALERALLIGSCLLVLITELLNSAVEATVDRFGGEHHELAGRAKDMGSGAVLISLMTTIIIWLLIVVERFG